MDIIRLVHNELRYETTWDTPIEIPGVGTVTMLDRNTLQVNDTVYPVMAYWFARTVNIGAVQLYVWEAIMSPGLTLGLRAKHHFAHARDSECPWPNVYLDFHDSHNTLLVVLHGTKLDPAPFATRLFAWLHSLHPRYIVYLGETFSWHDPSDFEAMDRRQCVFSFMLWKDAPHHPYRFHPKHVHIRRSDLSTWNRLLTSTPDEVLRESNFLPVVQQAYVFWRDVLGVYVRMLRPWLAKHFPFDLHFLILDYLTPCPIDESEIVDILTR